MFTALVWVWPGETSLRSGKTVLSNTRFTRPAGTLLPIQTVAPGRLLAIGFPTRRYAVATGFVLGGNPVRISAVRRPGEGRIGQRHFKGAAFAQLTNGCGSSSTLSCAPKGGATDVQHPMSPGC